ncbi:MAG: hypothetical protein CL470_03770 [Acidimicrobiaceae bacterium]|nr:hypothetical protein [Acidimicrobiaceae bacterium]|tara:strand:- start:1638 stop:1868 length:231 start_codon:yes stop_codon:yes gene_type:complete
MLIEIDRKLQMTLLLFIITMAVLYKIKLPIMFEVKTGKIKDFGTGPFKTIIPLWLAALSISLLCYVYLSIREDDFV